MTVRTMHPTEADAVKGMMRALWPDAGTYAFDDEIVFVWERPTGGLGGFASVSIRPWADGCESEPVPYIEGGWVAPDLRLGGVGRALFSAVERWAQEQGFTEIGSDSLLENEGSIAAHLALGFLPTERVHMFHKRLRVRDG